MGDDWASTILLSTVHTLRDVLPIAIILVVFQVLVLRKRVPNLKRVLVGFAYVVAGLALFLVGLEESLFPLGKIMATQLTDPSFIYGAAAAADPGGIEVVWWRYYWVFLFAAMILPSGNRDSSSPTRNRANPATT